MKTFISLFTIILFPFLLLSQNNGTLEATNGVIVGNNTGVVPGTIRWTGTDFQGYNGSTWQSLTTGGAGGTSLWNLNGNTNEIYYNADNVAIGKTDPTKRLDVFGQTRIQSGADGVNYQLEVVENGFGRGGIQFRNSSNSIDYWALGAGLESNSENKIGWYRNGDEKVVYHNTITNDPDGGMKIGTGIPVEKLDVDGAIVIGNAVNNNAGTIRWTGSDFEGYDGSNWISLTSTNGGGDITAVVAGSGLIGGGTTGIVTVDARANNGINVDVSNDRIQLGGALVNNTLITQNSYDYIHNLNSLGDFIIQDSGIDKFQIHNFGRVTVGDDFYVRDGSTLGVDLVKISDSSDDGVIDIYKAGNISNRLHGNGSSYINGGNLGIGTSNPLQKLHVSGTGRFTSLAGAGTRVVVADPNGDLSTLPTNTIQKKVYSAAAIDFGTPGSGQIIKNTFSVNNSGHNKQGILNLDLPEGTVIHQIRAMIYDKSTTVQVDISATKSSTMDGATSNTSILIGSSTSNTSSTGTYDYYDLLSSNTTLGPDQATVVSFSPRIEGNSNAITDWPFDVIRIVKIEVEYTLP